jgi:hypothetical protein
MKNQTQKMVGEKNINLNATQYLPAASFFCRQKNGTLK